MSTAQREVDRHGYWLGVVYKEASCVHTAPSRSSV